MEDLRFYHHFLFFAYPPLPYESLSILKDVSAMSYHVSIITYTDFSNIEP